MRALIRWPLMFCGRGRGMHHPRTVVLHMQVGQCISDGYHYDDYYDANGIFGFGPDTSAQINKQTVGRPVLQLLSVLLKPALTRQRCLPRP